MSNIQFFNLTEANEALNLEITNLNVDLIKEGCEILKVPYIGGGLFIVKRTDNWETEEPALRAQITKNLDSKINYMAIYYKIDKNHPRFAYYQVIVLRSSDLMDLKKALKINKLKAFL